MSTKYLDQALALTEVINTEADDLADANQAVEKAIRLPTPNNRSQ